MNQGIFCKVNGDAKEATIAIVGTIGWDMWADKFRRMLDELDDGVETVRFEIYSYGGDVWDGNDMMMQIGKLKQHTIADVQVAASMATLIAVACDEVRMAANGRWLIHNPWTYSMGDAAELEKRAKELRDTEAEAVAFYARKTGMTADELRTLMDEERWLTSTEAKDMGFVDEIDDPFDLDTYKDATAAMLAAKQIPSAMVAFAKAEPEQDDDATTDDDPEGDGQTGQNDGDDTGAGDGAPAPELSPEAQAHLDQIEQRLRAQSDAAYQEGYDAGKLAAEKPLREELASVRAELEKANSDHADEVEAYNKANDELRATIAEHERRLATLAGGISFEEPDDTPEDENQPKTWAEALDKYGYVQARKKFPSLFESYMDEASKK